MARKKAAGKGTSTSPSEPEAEEEDPKPLPRKLLIVKRVFPKSEGYDVMLEIAERTHTYQVTLEVGVEMLTKCIAIVVDIAMRGMPSVAPPPTKESKVVSKAVDQHPGLTD